MCGLCRPKDAETDGDGFDRDSPEQVKPCDEGFERIVHDYLPECGFDRCEEPDSKPDFYDDPCLTDAERNR